MLAAEAAGAPTGASPAVHHGVSCDRSGMNPIVGTRYHLPGTTGQSGSNLCQAEWDKLPPQEQATYERIEPPRAKGRGRKAKVRPTKSSAQATPRR